MGGEQVVVGGEAVTDRRALLLQVMPLPPGLGTTQPPTPSLCLQTKATVSILSSLFSLLPSLYTICPVFISWFTQL